MQITIKTQRLLLFCLLLISQNAVAQINSDTENLGKNEFEAIKNSTQIEEILQFCTKFPLFANKEKVDEKLADLIFQQQLIYPVESVLGSFPIDSFPQATTAIFEIYRTTGQFSLFESFQKKYPAFTDTLQLENELALAKLYDQLPKKYEPKDLSVFQNYIQKAAPRHTAYLALLTLLQQPIIDENWAEVMATAKTYSKYFGEDNKLLNELIKIAGTPKELAIQKRNLTALNSETDEYAPVISADNQSFYFCRIIADRERICCSRITDGDWSTPQIVESLQLGNDRAPLALSADGNELFIFDAGKLRTTTQENMGWTKPTAFSKSVSSSFWHGGTTLSSDGNILIFAARRQEMMGVPSQQNIDLFIALKNQDGTWSSPQNLGKVLNTTFSERSPFLHPDMKTLYFSSDGHGGLGGLDVYKTTRLDDSWERWSAPVNMGKMINTIEDDWGYTISTDGQLAYFSTRSLTGSHQDIFAVDIPKDFQPGKVSTISGKLTDKDGNPLDATLLIENLELGTLITSIKSNAQTGDFFIVLPDNRLYGYTVEKEGFFPASGNIDLRNVTNNHQQIKQNIQLSRLLDLVKENASLPLENLFFETGKAVIQNYSFPALNRLGVLIQQNDFQLVLEGHTDNIGDEISNLKLSEERAEAVKNYLVSKGCVSENIIAKGVGESQPIQTNDTEDGRRQNRRVEIRLGE